MIKSPRKRITATWFVASVVAMSVACIGGDGSGGGGGGPVPLADLEQQLGNVACEAARKCNIESLSYWAWALDRDHHCEEGMTRLIAGELGNDLARLRSLVASKRLRYDGAAARACIDSLKKDGCPSGKIDDWWACLGDAFGGDLEIACVSFGTLEPNLDCPAPASASGWHAPAQEGEPSCGTKCASDLVDVEEEVGPGDFRGICRASIALGASGCDDGSGSGGCEVGAKCAFDSSGGGPVSGVCRAVPEADIQEVVSIFTKDHPVGAPCKGGDWFQQGLCNPGLFCTGDTSTCAARKPDGEPCSSTDECESGFCNDAAASVVAVPGGACAVPSACPGTHFAGTGGDGEAGGAAMAVDCPVNAAGVATPGDLFQCTCNAAVTGTQACGADLKLTACDCGGPCPDATLVGQVYQCACGPVLGQTVCQATGNLTPCDCTGTGTPAGAGGTMATGGVMATGGTGVAIGGAGGTMATGGVMASGGVGGSGP